MRILVQRVSKASVEVEEKVVGAVGKGALVLVGITHDDTMEEVVWLANKFVSLRLFGRGEDGFQDSIVECGGEVLIVSQFTLYRGLSFWKKAFFYQSGSPFDGERII